MERTELQKALNEIIEVHRCLQDIYDYLPLSSIVTAINECYTLERQLRFLLDYDLAVMREAAWKQRQTEMHAVMSRPHTWEELRTVSAKYRGTLCYKKRYM